MIRKRCFEALEDRCLLTAAAGAFAAPPASGSNAVASLSLAESTLVAASQSGAALGDTTLTNGSSAADRDESPGEYAPSPRGATPPPASMPSGDEEDPSEYSNNASPSDSDAESYLAPDQAAATRSLAAALNEASQPIQSKPDSAELALVNAVATTGASAAPAAPAGAVLSNAKDLVVGSKPRQPLAVGQQDSEGSSETTEELADAITLQEPSESEIVVPAEELIAEPELEGAAIVADAASPQTAGLLAGVIATNVELIERSVDAFFNQLDDLGAELASCIGPRELGQALVTAAGAAAAWEYARARLRENDDVRTGGSGRAPRELQLPRTLSHRRETL